MRIYTIIMRIKRFALKNENEGISITRVIVIEILIMFAYFFTSFGLWNLFNLADLGNEEILMWGFIIIGASLMIVTVAYSEKTKRKS